MPESTPDRRSAATRAIMARWARPDSRARARARIIARYEAQADPDGALDPDERHRRAVALLRADMRRLAAISAQARARRTLGAAQS